MTSQLKRVCMNCKAHLSGPADSPLISHGIGPCCWDAYRVACGLPKKPYPVRVSA